MESNTYDIVDEEWERIKDMLPAERTGKAGRPCSTSNRNIWNGASWIGHTGSQWKELPSRYGTKSTVHERFKSWKDSGILEAIFAELSKSADRQDMPLDSTMQSASARGRGKKGGTETGLTAAEMRKK